MNATNKQFDSVDQMVRAVSESADFSQESEKYAADRAVTQRLFVLRTLKGLSQESIAREMECSQGRISKLEASADANLRLGDVAKYLSSLDMELRVVIAPKSAKITDEVKYHWARVRDLLHKLVEHAQDDPEMCKGVAKFHDEAAVNFLMAICASANRIPSQREEEDDHHIAVDVFGLDDDCPLSGRESELLTG